MSIYDYLSDEAVKLRVTRRKKRIHDYDERHDFVSEVYTELYDFMPFDRQEINEIIERVFRKYHSEAEI
jgi:hypothetical protein